MSPKGCAFSDVAKPNKTLWEGVYHRKVSARFLPQRKLLKNIVLNERKSP